MSDPSANEHTRPAQPPLGQPGPQVSRGLALAVLIALLASAGLSVWLMLAPGSGEEPVPDPAVASD